MRSWLVVVAGLGLAITLACAQQPAAAPAGTPAAAKPAAPAKLGGSVSVLGGWSSQDAESFKAVLKPFEEQTGVKVEFATASDVGAELDTRIKAGNYPDVAILPNPTKIPSLVSAVDLFQLGVWPNTGNWYANYSATALGLGTLSLKFYGLPFKATSSRVIWYNPKEFKANGWEVPKTWAELIALSDKMVAAGKTPWSIGADGGASVADWIENIMLGTAGPKVYEDWVTYNKIKWTDPAVKKAFDTFAQILGNPKYLYGGNQGAAATKDQDAALVLYQEKPAAYLYYGSGSVSGLIKAKYPNLKAGEDYAFFAFPTIDSKYGTPTVVTADLFVVLRETAQASVLFDWLATPDAATIWAKRGGFISLNQKVSPESYADPLSRATAQMLANAEILSFDASDRMPAALGNDAFPKQSQALVSDPKSVDKVLAALEQAAAAAFKK